MPNKNRGDRALKKQTRTRMRVTGESYTTARAQILRERKLLSVRPIEVAKGSK